MASLLRQIVSGPRARHPEAGLDLCYVTDFIIVTSGPSSVWPKKAYRNPVDQLVAYLDKKHGEEWAIFEFRAEGTGYPDEEVYNRIHHFPWPDHHPPPFAVIPNLMAAMRNWLHTPTQPGKQRVAVVHCKAGKGRSGTVACSYLISQEGWKLEEALKRFTTRRMRAGFGEGVSIPSQLRWVRYVDMWTNKLAKTYVERPVEVVELHVWGLRSGVKVCVEGYIEEGRRIKNFHTFTREEKINSNTTPDSDSSKSPPTRMESETLVRSDSSSRPSAGDDGTDSKQEVIQDVVLRPREPIRLLGSDINIDFERRNKSGYTGFTMVTSIAHVWFNAFFEGGLSQNDSGVFEIEWEAMDGIKGSERKGVKALDRLKVVWQYAPTDQGQAVHEPSIGEPVKEGKPTNWKGEGNPEKEIEAKHAEGLDSGRSGGTALTLSEMSSEAAKKLIGKDLGLRKSVVESANISRASSVKDEPMKQDPIDDTDTELERHDAEGVQSDVTREHVPSASDRAKYESHDHERQDTAAGKYLEVGIAKISNIISRMQGPDTEKHADK